jgi:hypothetical protein
MPYNANIPQANNQISVSQNDILQNFQSIFNAFTQNHEQFNIGTAGQHTMVQLATQAAAPAFAGIPGFWTSTAANNPIFLHTAAGVDRDISDKTWNGVQGSTMLPSGLIIKWGLGGAAAIGFTAAFPTAIFTVYVTNVGNAATTSACVIWAPAPTVAGFQASLNPGIHNFYWLAVGV